MATDFTMLEISNIGLKREEEEEEEIELSLELSIGRSYKKSKKSNPVKEKSTTSCLKIGADPVDLNGEIDPKSRRQIQALRRQEARKKREEKLKKSLCKGMDSSVNGDVSVSNCLSDEKVWLEAREFEARVRDRERKENEKSEIIRENCGVDAGVKDLNLTLTHGSNSMAPNVSSSIRVGPLQYPYPPVQFVQFTNGFVNPNVMPCWGLVAGNVGNNKERSEKKGFEAAVCRSFRPYRGNRNSNCGGNRKEVSNGSPGCSSSAISDYQSSSRQGGGNSDTGSNSSHSQPEQQQQLNSSAASHPPEQSEHSGSSNQMESKEAIDKSSNYIVNVVSSSIPQSSPVIPSGSDTKPDPVNNPISTTQNPTPAPLIEETKGVMGKPQIENHDTPSLPQMPCVSTTGNGPNGKTITGFLYRYTTTEVSIVCVCHGNSFSPAEFVEHAGGIDIANPLRHITMVSSPFG